MKLGLELTRYGDSAGVGVTEEELSRIEQTGAEEADSGKSVCDMAFRVIIINTNDKVQVKEFCKTFQMRNGCGVDYDGQVGHFGLLNLVVELFQRGALVADDDGVGRRGVRVEQLEGALPGEEEGTGVWAGALCAEGDATHAGEPLGLAVAGGAGLGGACGGRASTTAGGTVCVCARAKGAEEGGGGGGRQHEGAEAKTVHGGAEKKRNGRGHSRRQRDDERHDRTGEEWRRSRESADGAGEHSSRFRFGEARGGAAGQWRGDRWTRASGAVRGAPKRKRVALHTPIGRVRRGARYTCAGVCCSRVCVLRSLRRSSPYLSRLRVAPTDKCRPHSDHRSRHRRSRPPRVRPPSPPIRPRPKCTTPPTQRAFESQSDARSTP